MLSVQSLQLGGWLLTQTADGFLSFRPSSGVGGISVPSMQIAGEIGNIMMWRGSIASIPANWALCNGQTVAGVSTPDLQDRFIVGAGNSYTPAEVGGTSQVSLTIDQIPVHSHTYIHHDSNCAAGGCGTPCRGDIAHEEQTGGTGGGQPHENRPPYFALAYIMRVK